MLYPMLLISALKETVWGKNEIYNMYGKGNKDRKIGESWELSCRDDLKSVIANGPFAGKTITEVFYENKKAFTGKTDNKFPWLIKFIDANDNLSVQVHPDNEYAEKAGDVSGKTEMWHILSAKPGSKLIVGFKKKVSKEDLKVLAANGGIVDILNEVEVKNGDTFFIPSGMVHAIGKGIVLLEIQQNSDATYRLYDWQRKDDSGNFRELHIDKAADVADRTVSSPAADNTTFLENGNELLAKCKYFTVTKRTSDKADTINGMASIIVTKGTAVLGKLDLKAGDTVFIPYECKKVPFKVSGEAVIVLQEDFNEC